MCSEFIDAVGKTAFAHTCGRLQGEKYLACVYVMSYCISDDVAVNVGECVSVELERDVLDGAFAK